MDETRGMAIAVPDHLQERGTEVLYGCVWQVGDLPANLRFAGRLRKDPGELS